MEASTAAASTVDGLDDDRRPAGLAAERYGDRAAVRYKRDGEWHDVSFAEVGEIVSEIARGLIDLGLQPGDRVVAAVHHPPRVDLRRLRDHQRRRRRRARSTRPTPRRSASGWPATRSRASIVCEDASQVAKIDAGPRRACPRSRHVIVDRARRRRDRARRPARARPRRATPPRSPSARAAVKPEDPYTFIYTSGTTGPPKGCVLTHGNYRASSTRSRSSARSSRRRGRLPLPAARARLRAADPAAVGRPRLDDRLLRRRPEADHPRAQRGPPDLPAVGAADLREALHARHRATATRRRSRRATQVGLKVRAAAGRRPGGPGRAPGSTSTRPSEALFKNVRAAFGGNLKQANTGAAPIAKEILEFFYACGVPVLEGYGMTETSTVVDDPDARPLQARHGRLRAPGLGDQDRRRRRDPAQGPEHLPGLLQDARTSRSARSWTAGCTPATSARSTRTASSRSPAARRTSSSPRAARTSRRPTSRTTSSRPLDLAGRDARRPPAVPGRAGHARPEEAPALAQELGIEDADLAALAEDPKVHELIQGDPRRGQRELRPGRAGQEVHDPRPRPLAGDRRADADAEGQAQRGQREVRRPLRRALQRLSDHARAAGRHVGDAAPAAALGARVGRAQLAARQHDAEHLAHLELRERRRRGSGARRRRTGSTSRSRAWRRRTARAGTRTAPGTGPRGCA